MKIISGNIFSSKCKCIVNTVNCVGVMGAGIALECKLRWPDMFADYSMKCKTKTVRIGSVDLFKANNRWIINFPTKNHWRNPSKIEYLEQGLQSFRNLATVTPLVSVAFPILGSQNGGLNPEIVLNLMKSALTELPCEIEIYKYDFKAYDDLFEHFKDAIFRISIEELHEKTNIRKSLIDLVRNEIMTGKYFQINQLGKIRGLGQGTLEKIFRFITENTINVEARQLKFPEIA